MSRISLALVAVSFCTFAMNANATQNDTTSQSTGLRTTLHCAGKITKTSGAGQERLSCADGYWSLNVASSDGSSQFFIVQGMNQGEAVQSIMDAGASLSLPAASTVRFDKVELLFEGGKVSAVTLLK